MTVKSTHKPGRVALAATLGMALAISVSGFAKAADDDDDPDSAMIDTKIVRGILNGLGLKKDGEGIDYRERSPLVLPPGKDMGQLPVPQSDAQVQKTAGWPVDPDVKSRQDRKKQEKDRKAYIEGVDDRPLRPGQMLGPSGAKPDNASARSAEQSAAPSTASELGSKSMFSSIKNLWGTKEEYATFVSEPPRNSLIEPPTGYRTPSPNQPYGVGPTKGDYTQKDRQEPVK